ncbi:MAG: PD40 domain-containing protein, partial [Candidatus Cloacimonetes bacterium]|nr:PD40 domain-containing protein [Candidatus Cloacimonadota bacterium]
ISLFASFGQNKVQQEKEEWTKIESMHFDIYYPKGENEFGKIALLTAEEAYYYLKKDFIRPIIGRVPIIIYKSHSAFQTTNVINSLLSQGVGGFTESLRNRIVIPFDGDFRKFEEVLTHEMVHAYVNDFQNKYSSARFFSNNTSYMPFWLSEGLPEFQAVKGRSSYNNMFILDMTLNDYLYPLENISGYYAYREGESFLTYIGEVYGSEKVMDYFHSIRSMGNLEKSTEKLFGMKFNQLQNRWKTSLKKKYFSLLQECVTPYEKYEQLTNHIEDNTYFNFFPVFSPDGNSFLYMNNRDYRNSIMLGDANGINKPDMLIRGETTNRFEQFHMQRTNPAWFPDGKRFAFAASSNKGDVIYIAEAINGDILQSIHLPDLDAIFELSINKEGTSIAFAAQKNMQSDIYIYSLETEQVKMLTDDFYNDMQPCFSPDGTKLAFTSERRVAPDSLRNGIFSSFVDNIYFYNFATGEFYQVTDEDFNNSKPIWTSDGKSILFLSDNSGTTNYEIINLETGSRAKVTNTLSGVFSGDLNADNNQLLVSVFYNNGWDIFKVFKPLDSLSYSNHGLPKTVVLENDLSTRFEIDRYRYFSKRDRKFKDEFMKQNHPNSTILNMKNVAVGDSLIRDYNDKLDMKPDSVYVIPKVTAYKPKFLMDYLYGGGAYSTSDGAIGFIETTLTDLMGNHTIGAMAAVAGDLEDSSIYLSYIYRPYKWDIGVSGFYLSDETIYYSAIYDDVYYREREHIGGFNLLFRYPISRFWRWDAALEFQKIDTIWDTGHDNGDELIWDERIKDWDEDDYALIPALELVHDNTLYGSTGPMTGWRAYYHIGKSFAKENRNYLTQAVDFRYYFLFAKNFNISARVFGGWSTGEDAQTFSLDSWSGFSIGNSSGIRGFTDDSYEGTKKALSSLELRVPFIEYLKLGFPLPLALGNVRGSIYADLGTVWDDTDSWQGAVDGKLTDLIMGFGMGPRLNMGYFVLKFDVAWTTDMYQTSQPVYSVSISEDF